MSQDKQYPAKWLCSCGKGGRSRTLGAAKRAAMAHRPRRGYQGCVIRVEEPGVWTDAWIRVSDPDSGEVERG